GRRPPIPENTITKSLSAELRPRQKDTDTLPDYAILDPILDAYPVRQSGIEEILDSGFDAVVVPPDVGIVNAAGHERRQYPPCPPTLSSIRSSTRTWCDNQASHGFLIRSSMRTWCAASLAWSTRPNISDASTRPARA